MIMVAELWLVLVTLVVTLIATLCFVYLTGHIGQGIAAPASHNAHRTVSREEIQLRWIRLVNKAYGVRKLQRVFHNTGEHLQVIGYSRPFGKRLSGCLR